MSTDAKLTPFSYVILALVGRGGASAHDIVRMMRQGTMFWTTSESHFYAEPKRLAKLGYLAAQLRPGRTRERTFYELTPAGREALASWIAQPAAMPRVQNEAAAKLLGADFSDEQAVLASLRGLRGEIELRYSDLAAMESRAAAIPHRTRYLRLLVDLARRTLDTQREWLEHVEHELGSTPAEEGS